MKVVCIDNKNGNCSLTISKTYNVIYQDKWNYYKIINDKIKEDWYDHKLFRPLSEYRNEKIDKLLKDENKMHR